MAKIKFPKRRDDKSFVVYARFRTSNHAILALVRDYLKAWTKANSTWTRVWRSDVIKEERLEFYSEFLLEPRVEAGPGESSFSVVLEGRPCATRWKDWTVFLVGDISRVFPEVKFERFDS